MFNGAESGPPSSAMGDRTTVKQLTSIRLQKAINKNQTFDLELKKELQVLDVKRKASEKAFDKRRTQFLRNRLCVEPLKKSKSFNRGDGAEKRRQERAKIPGLLDLRTCYSTGNLLESLLSPRNDPSYAISEGSGKLFKKLSLDSANDNGGKSLKNWVKTFSEPNDWSEDKTFQESDKGNHDVHQYGSSFKTLKVPSVGKKLSFSDDNLSDKTCRQGKWAVRRQERLKSWGASNRLTIPPITKPLSKSDESLSRRNENATMASQKKHLSLPPLRRTRSKSLEALRVSPENEAETSTSEIKGVKDTRKLSWTDVAKVQRVKKGSRVSGSVNEQSKKQEAVDGVKEEEDVNLEPKNMERSSSTPDLLDIEPEVEYLLLKDDKIRLRRMRASLHAISLMDDMKEYRYIRNVEFTNQNKQETNPQTDKVSDNDYLDHAQIDRTESETFLKPKYQATHDVTTTDVGEGMGDTTEPKNLEDEGTETSEQKPYCEEEVFDGAKRGDEAPASEQDRLNSSTGSSLADMFDEIRHTRYLRVRPRMSMGDPDDDCDNDNDNDDDSCNISYGYRVPLIIVGHTKAVLKPDDEPGQ